MKHYGVHRTDSSRAQRLSGVAGDRNRDVLLEVVVAFKAAWRYMLFGVALGGTVLGVYAYIEAHELLPKGHFVLMLLEHAGMACLVSAFVVFFYEWGAHISKTAELSKELNDTIRHLVPAIGAELHEQRLTHSIRSLIKWEESGDKTSAVSPEPIIVNLVHALVAINENTELWARNQYIGFITSELDVVVKNAMSLSRLGSSGSGDQQFTVRPTAAAIADAILSAQMVATMPGDRYDVISSIPTWQGNRLKEFEAMTITAVRSRKVRVRRILNLLSYPDELMALPGGTARDILMRHYQLVLDLGATSSAEQYEVKILGEQEVQLLPQAQRRNARNSHYGIFVHATEQVRFSVRSHDLDKMHITNDPDIVCADRELFDAAWAIARPLTLDAIEWCETWLEYEKLSRQALARADRAVHPPGPLISPVRGREPEAWVDSESAYDTHSC